MAKWKPGDLYALPILDQKFAFAQVGLGGDIGFFDLLANEVVSIDRLRSVPLAFRVAVAKEALAKGSWRFLGNEPTIGELAELSSYRHQPVGSTQIFIYRGGESKPASAEVTSELEPLATWFWMHVQSRLEDHFCGRSNRFVEDVRRVR